jgi:hypothetical protein
VNAAVYLWEFKPHRKVRLDPLNISEVGQTIEEKTSTTSDVKNLMPVLDAQVIAKSVNNQVLSGSPPPVFLVEPAICLNVILTHAKSLH